MIKMQISGLEGAVKRLDSFGKQVRKAASSTLNRLALLVTEAEKHEMRDSFDRPTDFTLKSLTITKGATRDDLSAVVGFKQSGTGRPASAYLRWQIQGGQRRLKAFELALRTIGALPGDHYIVPGKGASMDAFGNVSRGQIVAILSYFKAFPEDGRGWKMNSTAETRRKMAKGTRTRFGYRYFVGRPGAGRGPMGIFQDVRIGAGTRELLPVFIFVRWTRYEQRLDIETPAVMTVRRHAADVFSEALAQAMAAAR